VNKSLTLFLTYSFSGFPSRCGSVDQSFSIVYFKEASSSSYASSAEEKLRTLCLALATAATLDAIIPF